MERSANIWRTSLDDQSRISEKHSTKHAMPPLWAADRCHVTESYVSGVCVEEVAGWGWCGVAGGDSGLIAARIDMETKAACLKDLSKVIPTSWRPDRKVAASSLEQLINFLRGRITPRVTLDPKGTPFATSIWKSLSGVPRGTTITYTDLCKSVGLSSHHARAVGRAISSNPIWVLIPCHRVVGRNGCLTGYAGGLNLKQRLLDLEAKTTAN